MQEASGVIAVNKSTDTYGSETQTCTEFWFLRKNKSVLFFYTQMIEIHAKSFFYFFANEKMWPVLQTLFNSKFNVSRSILQQLSDRKTILNRSINQSKDEALQRTN